MMTQGSGQSIWLWCTGGASVDVGIAGMVGNIARLSDWLCEGEYRQEGTKGYR
jgi:hypothetical protein